MVAVLVVGAGLVTAFPAASAVQGSDPTGTCNYSADGGAQVLWVWSAAGVSCLAVSCDAGAGTGAGVLFALAAAYAGCNNCYVAPVVGASTVSGAYVKVQCTDDCYVWTLAYGGVDGNMEPTYGVKGEADCTNLYVAV